MSDKKPYNEAFLLKQLAKGDSCAFKKLYNHYHQDVYAYGFSMLKSKENAEEIVQDVFLKVWKNRRVLRLDTSFKSYIFTITRNTCLNLIVKLKNDKRLKSSILEKYHENLNTTEAKILDAEYARVKNKIFEQLPPRRKLIFELSRNEGLSYADISDKLGISISTVKGQMNKSLEFIRTFLRTNTDISLVITWFIVNLFY